MRYCILFFTVFFFISCETEVQIIYPTVDPLPVVYGIVDPYDSISTIRVQRSFVLRDKNNIQHIPYDSLYFNEISVSIQGIRDDIVMWEEELCKTEVMKQEGQFFVNHHYVFSTDSSLPVKVIGATEYYPGVPDIDRLKLKVDIIDLDTTVETETTILSPLIVQSLPSKHEISLYGKNVTEFHPSVRCRDNTGRFYSDIEFSVRISEYIDGKERSDTIVWHTSKGFDGGYKLTPERIFNRIMMGIDNNPNVTTRILHGIDVKLTSVVQNFGDYIFNKSEFETMIDYPIMGFPNAIGFFHTKSTGHLNGMQLDRVSMDSLCNGQKWKHLKFRHW